MVKQYKIDEVANLARKLQERKNIILTNYSGIKVKSLSELRRKIREKGGEYKVIKNNLFKRAMNEVGAVSIDQHLKGPIGVVFIKDDVGEIAKVLRDFAKEQEKFAFSLGVLDNVVYNADQVKQIADLPSREILLSQVMSLVNGPGTKIAIGINQIMASLARGINAVAEKNAL